MTLQAVDESRSGFHVPPASAPEAVVVEGRNVYPIGGLAKSAGFFSGQVDIEPQTVDHEQVFLPLSHTEEDFVHEEGCMTISRALRRTTFPAEFILVAAMNPLPVRISIGPEACV
jgi:magnesium chelatase family protein